MKSSKTGHGSYSLLRQANTNNSHVTNSADMLHVLPPIHKLRRSIQRFHKQASPLTQQHQLNKRFADHWERQLNKFMKDLNISDSSTGSIPAVGGEKYLDDQDENPLALSRLHKVDAYSHTVIKKLPDSAQNLSLLLNSVDQRAAKSGMTNWKSRGTLRSFSPMTDTSKAHCLQPQTLEQLVNDLEPLDRKNSPRISMEPHDTQDRRNLRRKPRQTRKSSLRKPKCLAECDERSSKPKIEHVFALLKPTERSQSHFPFDPTDENIGGQNASNVGMLSNRQISSEEEAFGSAVRRSPATVGFEAFRDRRQSLFALQQLRLANQRRLESEWETELSQSSGARKFRVLYYTYRFVELTIRVLLRHRGLLNTVRDSRYFSYSQPSAPTEVQPISCPLLQATLRSFMFIGPQLKSNQNQVTCISDPPLYGTQLPFYMKSLRIGPKPIAFTKQIESGGKRTGSRSPSFRRPRFISRSISVKMRTKRAWSSAIFPQRLLADEVLDNRKDLLVKLRITFKQIIASITRNVIGDNDFHNIRKFQLLSLLTNIVRDRCRDLYQVNHSCDACLCRSNQLNDREATLLEHIQDSACYTIVVYTYAIEKREQGMMVSSQMLRDPIQDTLITHNYEKENFVVIVVVYLIRKYVFFSNGARKFLNYPSLNTLYKYWLEDKVSWVDYEADKND
ncbi:hypothetical protein CRM22_008824 [Opisthorchis felineus]|uniref:Uncharacterized protein n=1 Tax=Opisthorchis felineus TaxID=147828 RepID=A0A4S2LHL1_OPIFE|nr:hypothetical protein CRM22_008824 [Opisthorchis felineus]